MEVRASNAQHMYALRFWLLPPPTPLTTATSHPQPHRLFVIGLRVN